MWTTKLAFSLLFIIWHLSAHKALTSAFFFPQTIGQCSSKQPFHTQPQSQAQPSIEKILSDANTGDDSTSNLEKNFSALSQELSVHRFYGPIVSAKGLLLRRMKLLNPSVLDIQVQDIVNVESSVQFLGKEDSEKMEQLFGATQGGPRLSARESESLANQSQLFEVGPRTEMRSAWHSNVCSILNGINIHHVERVEKSQRYLVTYSDTSDMLPETEFYDKMTEQIGWYGDDMTSISTTKEPEKVKTIPLLENGNDALKAFSEEHGLGLDSWALDFYGNLFRENLRRNPTDVELFDLGQSNSEHCRHWFFNGEINIDGKPLPCSLLQMVKNTLKTRQEEAKLKEDSDNSIIAFCDNSSGIKGFQVNLLQPTVPSLPSPFTEVEGIHHATLTAETHNFPCGVAPFPGAETGVGGRLRDIQATGQGGRTLAGIAGYSVGDLEGTECYPKSMALPKDVLIQASNGASDYANKFGEPLVAGFARSFGGRNLSRNGQRKEWIKPIMFSAGIGSIKEEHVVKAIPEEGMQVVKIGGPAYRIGLGGGSASSRKTGRGEQEEHLDTRAVQRGDAEMGNKLARVVRACSEANEPIILSLHDQGAGGNANVLKELVAPSGAAIDATSFPMGDSTLSILELWASEYQENHGLLVSDDGFEKLKSICEREGLPIASVGRIDGSRHIKLFSPAETSVDHGNDNHNGLIETTESLEQSVAVDLPLEEVLEVPRRTYDLKSTEGYSNSCSSTPIGLEKVPDPEKALIQVLKLISVGSKRFLTSKVDRSVGGLVAAQPCVGPFQLPVGNLGATALSFTGREGVATAVGEKPLLSLLDPEAMARMSVAEALTNLVWAKWTKLEDIKASANWMWAVDQEGAQLCQAVQGMTEFMERIGIAVDGGKDSLSMSVDVEGESITSPGTLVVSAYVTIPDVEKLVTPDLKMPAEGKEGALYFLDLASNEKGLGCSALAQVYDLGQGKCPDVGSPSEFKKNLLAVQELIQHNLVAAGHDISEGGLVSALVEMGIAGNCGVTASLQIPETLSRLTEKEKALSILFNEGPGLLIELEPGEKEQKAVAILENFGASFQKLGRSTMAKSIYIEVDGVPAIKMSTHYLRQMWESTSLRLDRLQSNPETVFQEAIAFKKQWTPKWNVPFEYSSLFRNKVGPRQKMALLREEGTNGDRELASAFHMAGFEVWDLTTSDLIEGRINLDEFKGIAFAGGFSFADALGSAIGWAARLRSSPNVWKQLQAFRARSDTFSLGICNGCQLMVELGWVGKESSGDPASNQCNRSTKMIENTSGRFESRFSTIKIQDSNAILLQGMEGATLGVWVANREGRFSFSKRFLDGVKDKSLAPIRYISDDSGTPSERYPYNPSGSPAGIAALCSEDGRHLAMMPHPERCFLQWQLPWLPQNISNKRSHVGDSEKISASTEGAPSDVNLAPWSKLFHNAFKFASTSQQ